MVKTKGQIEDMLTKRSIKFYLETIGVGPQKAKTYILEDMIIIRLKGNLLPIEQKLLHASKGIDLVKNIRKSLHELTIPEISKIIKEVTRQTVISAHSDISTKTGEIVDVFILSQNYQKQLELGNY